MPTYQYKAKKKNADTASGKIIADNKEDAVEKIHQLGLIPINVEDTNPAAQIKGNMGAAKVSQKGLYLFSRQLVNLLKSGLPILRALDIISAQVKDPYLKNIIASIQYGIQEGRSFSECLSDFPNTFSPLYIAMVKAGEESGNLHVSVGRLAEYLKGQEEISSKVRTALAYPVLMLVFGVGTVFFILGYVMPQITELFNSLNQELPTPTILVMKLSSFLVEWGLLFIIAILILGVILNRWLKTEKGNVFKSRLITATPMLGTFWIKVELARFCRTLELLLSSGTPVLRGIKLSIPVISNQILKTELNKCEEELVAGRSFGNSLKQAEHIPDIIGNLMVVGEESGSLTGPLTDISESYEQEINESIKVMTTLLEPVMIIVVGGFVGFVIVSMLLPIFQLDIFAR